MTNKLKLKTVPQFCNDNPAFKLGGIRAMLFHRGQDAEESGAVVRFGRKLLIDEDAFLEWVKAGGARRISGAQDPADGDHARPLRGTAAAPARAGAYKNPGPGTVSQDPWDGRTHTNKREGVRHG